MVAGAAALGVLGMAAWRRRVPARGGRRTAGGHADPGGAGVEPTLAEAEAWLARRAGERRARALANLGELRERLADAAARCDAYLDGEAGDIGLPEPAWHPYAEAGAALLGGDREAYVVVAAACRGMETVAGAPAPERVEPVRRMIGRAIDVLGRLQP